GAFVKQGNAIMAFLAVKNGVIAQLLNKCQRKKAVFDFCLLQTDNIRLMLVNNSLKLMETRANAIDVKGHYLHDLYCSTTCIVWLEFSWILSTRIIPASFRKGSSSSGIS